MSYIYDHTVNDILTAAEVAESLNITKQRLSVLVSEKRIHYKRKKNGVLIFMRQDIEEYKNKETYKSEKLKDLVGITSRSLEFYEKHKYELGDIYRITIYANDIDAIHDNNYEQAAENYGDKLFRLDVPSMIIKGKKNEMWLGGCNCGYYGTGPLGTIKILESLGIKLSYNDIDNKVLEYNKINNEWKLSLKREKSIEEKVRSVAPLKFFVRRGKLILIQDNTYVFERNIIELLCKYNDFMPNPYSITFIRTDEEAFQHGYYLNSYDIGNTIYFKLILEDKGGNQIWFPFYYDEKKSIYESPTIKHILEYCGFETKELSKYEKVKNWINLNIFNKPFESDILTK